MGLTKFKHDGFTTEALPRLPLYLLTALLARLADEGIRVAFVLGAADRGLSVRHGGFLVAAFLIPHVLAAPLVGGLADRFRHKARLYAAAYLGFGAAILGCGLLMGRAPFAVVLLVALAGGSVGPLVTGGLTSLLAGLVPPERLSRAYSLDVATYNLAAIASPALVAVAIGVAGSLPSIGLLALCMGGAALGAALLPLEASLSEPAALRGGLLEGAKVLWRDVPLRATSLAAGLGSAGGGALPVALTLLAQTRTGVNPGFLLSVLAVGALAGSVAFSLLPVGGARPERVVILGTALSGLPFIGMLVFPSPLGAALLLALVGFLSGPVAASQFAVRERHSPLEVKTQVFALAAGIKTSVAALGAVVAGVLVPAGGAVLLAVIAGFYLLAALVGGVLLRGAQS